MTESQDMAAASKPLEECASAPPAKVSSDFGMGSIVYAVAKKICIVGVVYLAGYMNWSIAWFIGPLVLSVMRDQWRKESDLRRTIAKASAMASDKEVVLARVDELPAWVFFPDIERAEWLNRIMVQVWPNVNHYAREIIKDTIEPNVCASLANYKLNGFKFERMILGTIPPRIGGVKVYDKNLSRNEIIMDIDLFYAGDCDISFVLGGIKGGIKDFQIHGMLRVVMKPLLKTMPMVGGLQIFFLNNPTIDFNLVGVADILDMPGFSDVLRKCIVEQVAAMVVLPNKLPIKLSDDVPSHDLKTPEPEGVLRIHVVEAKNLMKKDIGMLGKGKSDPYALISVGAQEFRTQTIDNTVNPKWDYWCEAQISSRKRQCIGLELWDWDPGFPGAQNDDFLGRCTVEISSVAKKGQIDTWLTLEQAKHGMVHLRLTWYKLSAVLSDLKLAIQETQLLRVSGMSTAILTMFVDSVKGLPNARVQSKPDPYLVINVGKKTENTAVQMRTDDPVYEIGYTFLVGNPENDTIHIKAMDQKTGNQLAMLDYNLASLLEKPSLQVEREPFPMQRGGPNTKILLSLCLRVLKYSEPDSSAAGSQDGDEADAGSSPSGSVAGLARQESAPLLNRGASVKSNASTGGDSNNSGTPTLNRKTLNTQTTENKPIEEDIHETVVAPSEIGAPSSPKLVHRTLSTTSSAGEAGLGRIQLTLRYSVQRQRLVVVVHKIANIPLKDPSNIPDPYVKLYLLPGRAKDSKRKTAVMKDNCNPVYDETFEYIMSQGEVNSHQLEVSVGSQKGFFAGGSPVIGQVKVDLGDCDLSQAKTWWLDLLPESKD